jgi:nicotinate-nucleotide pyrophosphorylase (carboxylating)
MRYDGKAMANDFRQLEWDPLVQDDCRQIVRLAVREDLDQGQDWTSLALIPAGRTGAAMVVARTDGVIAGLRAGELALREMEVAVEWSTNVDDGDSVTAGQGVARLAGSTRDILTTERIVLNLLGRMSGIATLTRQYVDQVGNLPSQIYDTRKTTPGWRRLEKYAVRCGGGRNHRTGLFDAILIKDNHLAGVVNREEKEAVSGEVAQLEDCCPATSAAVEQVRGFIAENQDLADRELVVEIEVDTLKQLSAVLSSAPDVVLLDNMSPGQLREAVALRDAIADGVVLEASGGVSLANVASIAKSGVDRISVGALTHSATALDLALDWLP